MNPCECKDKPLSRDEVLRSDSDFVLTAPRERAGGAARPGADSAPPAGGDSAPPAGDVRDAIAPADSLGASLSLSLVFLALFARDPRVRPGLIVDDTLTGFVNAVSPDQEPAAASWSPSDLDATFELSLHGEATMESDTGLIRWTNSGTAGGNVYQPTASKQPAKLGAGDKARADFDGGNDEMDANESGKGILLSDVFTQNAGHLFIVAKPDSLGSDVDFWRMDTLLGVGVDFGVGVTSYYANGNPALKAGVNYGNYGGDGAEIEQQYSNGTALHVFEVKWDGAKLYVSVDGAAYSSAVAAAGLTSLTEYLRVGRNQSQYFEGQVCAMFGRSTLLTSGERADLVANLLAFDWGVS